MKEELENLIFDFIVENEIATEQEITLVTKINGWSVETLNSIIYCRTGYHDAKQCMDCENEIYFMTIGLAKYYNLNI